VIVATKPPTLPNPNPNQPNSGLQIAIAIAITPLICIPTAPAAPSELQAQLHDTQTSLTSLINKMHAPKGVFAVHDAIEHEVGVLRHLVKNNKSEAGHRESQPEHYFGGCLGLG